jgi:uncharacterized membrane protein YphA (DoxX/SURF4 family)
MNILLWILQVLLALAFLAHGWLSFVAYQRQRVRPIRARAA